MPQNPTRQVHAVLAGFVQDALINNQNHNHKTDKIIARTLFFRKNQNCDLCFDRLNNRQNACWKNFAKQTRTMILENLTLPKTDNVFQQAQQPQKKPTKFCKLNLPETLL